MPGHDEEAAAAPYTSFEYERKPSARDVSRRDSNADAKQPQIHKSHKNAEEPFLDDHGEEIYVVRQMHGYMSIIFSGVQTIILGLMMWQCGIAPLNINPMFGPYPDALSEWGGKNSVLILEDGEWYRLVTPILLHAGIIHLLGNVAVQLEMGLFFEREWGSLRWLIIYIGSAFGSSILSVIVMPTAVSVGSSGAVMGLFGGKLAEVVVRACERNVTQQERLGHEVRQEQCGAVTCSVIVVMAFSFIPYVDWAAHLGGLVAGFVIGLAVFAWEEQTFLGKFIWFMIGIAVTTITFAVALQYMYGGNVELIEELHDVCGYYTANFDGYECRCMREEYMQNGGGSGSGSGDK